MEQGIIETKKCERECDGLFADIHHQYINDTIIIERKGEKAYKKTLDEYQQYKRNYVSNYLDYFSTISEAKGWPFLNTLNKIKSRKVRQKGTGLEISKPYKVEESLQIVEIYFNTPTFKKITLDSKANFITMVSTIGGTFGLFSGFSILSGAEIIYFLLKMFFHLCYTYLF